MDSSTVYIYLQSYDLSKPYLARALDSIINQTYKNFVCCIYDNCSGAEVRNILEAYVTKDSRFRVSYFDVPVNLVYDYAFPDILNLSCGNGYYTRVDADDELEKDALEKMVTFAQKNELDLVVAGATFINGNTGEVIGQRKIDKDLIVIGKEYGSFFQKTYQLMRTHWIKICKMSVINSFNYANIKLVDYGSDTAFVREIVLLSNRIGFLSACLYKYYRFDPYNKTYNANRARVFAPQNLLEMDKEFLLKKCGCVSEENARFLFFVYLVEINDLFGLIKNGNFGEAKLDLLYEVLCNDNFKIAARLYDTFPVYEEIARYLFEINIFQNIDSVQKAARIFASLLIYPADNRGINDEKFIFLLQMIHYYWDYGDTKEKIESIIDKKIKEIPLLKNVKSFFICQCSEIIGKLAFCDYKGVLTTLIDYFKQSNCYYREHWEKELIVIGLNLSAKIDDSDSFVLFKKLEIKSLLKYDIDKAKAEIAEWIKILPHDTDFIEFNNMLLENDIG